MQAADPAGPITLGFRSHWTQIVVETSVLDQPGWGTQLRLLWRSVSKLLQPFYGDVRTLHSWTWHGARLGGNREAQSHPVTGWWWRGLPTTPASAVVIGPHYQRIWPDLVANGAHEDGLVFVDQSDWRNPATYVVPAELTQQKQEGLLFIDRQQDRSHFAVVWPFDGPYLAK